MHSYGYGNSTTPLAGEGVLRRGLRCSPAPASGGGAGWGSDAANRPMPGMSRWGRAVLIGLPFAWLAVFFLLPLAIVAAISFAEGADAIPPYLPLVGHGAGGFESHATLASYRILAEGCLRAYWASLGTAALATAICLTIGYPLAFAIARAPGPWRHLLLFFVLLPFWTSLLIRVYAWIALLQPTGLINKALLAVGAIDRPLVLLNDFFAVEVGLVYAYLPF